MDLLLQWLIFLDQNALTVFSVVIWTHGLQKTMTNTFLQKPLKKPKRCSVIYN